jgi:hypothetical protein
MAGRIEANAGATVITNPYSFFSHFLILEQPNWDQHRDIEHGVMLHHCRVMIANRA